MERWNCLSLGPIEIPFYRLRDMTRNYFYWAAVCLIGFNIWHSANRGIWNGSILDSLTIGSYTLELAQKTDPRIRPWKSYDGQFFYAMTFDPLLISKNSVRYIDAPAYRYRRILYPLLASILSLGQPHFFPYSLFAVNVFAWLLTGFILWKIANLEKLPSFWLVIGGLFNTGLIYATFRTLSETLMTASILCGCYFWKKESWVRSSLFFAAATLVREVALLVPITILIYELFKENKNPKKLIYFSLILAIFPLIWWSYLSFRLPANAGNAELQRLSLPFLGMFKELWISIRQQTSHTEHIRTFAIPALTVPLSLFIFLRFKSFPTLWGALALAQAIFCSIVRGDIWNYHASSARVIILLTIFSTLWFFEIACPNSARSHIVRS